MKRVVFLIIAIIWVLGLVLPGCGEGGGDGGYVPWRALKTPGKLTIGVTEPMGYDQGLHALWGAQLAASSIGSFSVGNQTLTVTIVPVETNEIVDPTGLDGTVAVLAAIESCDFMVGGFRTEAVLPYRQPIMDANMTFIDCGAATELLCHSVVTNYAHFKWFFKGAPMNEYLLAESQSKVLTLVIAMATAAKPAFVPRIAILAEDAQWTMAPREAALANFQAAGYTVGQGLWLVAPNAGAIGATLASINATSPNIIYTLLSGRVGMTYGKNVGVWMPHVLSIGVNVEAQRQEFGTEATWANGTILVDGWAPGVNLSDSTAGFLDAFATAHSGTWPIYTAATYDAVNSLVEALQSEGYVDGSTVKYVPEDVVVHLETATRLGAAAKKTGVYPLWDGTTTGTYYEYPGKSTAGLPALNESQVLALYPWLASAKFSDNVTVSSWTYTADNWTMQPHTTHDLVYGSEWAGGIASQWQWNGTGLSKVCVWPKQLLPLILPTDLNTFITDYLPTCNASTLYGLQRWGLWDQYGWWNFEYPGTGSLNLTDWILSL